MYDVFVHTCLVQLGILLAFRFVITLVAVIGHTFMSALSMFLSRFLVNSFVLAFLAVV